MFEAIIAFFTLYTLLKLYISTMQIGLVDRERSTPPVFMSQTDYQKAASYAIAKERLGMLESLLEYGVFLFWIGGGLAWLYGVFATTLHSSLLLGSAGLVLLFLLIPQLAGLPLEVYRTFVLDKRYGFSTTTPKLFIADQLKGVLILVVLATPLVMGVVWIMQEFAQWWLAAFGLIYLFYVLLNFLAPTLIMPLFNKMEPLQNPALQEQIESLLHRVGFRSSGVFVMDASKRDTRLNAYFGGLGSTKRVVLFDTLISKVSPSELLAVLGHELGHFKHHDLLKSLLLMGGMLFGVFALAGHLPPSLFLALGLPQMPALTLCLILLLAPPFLFGLMPLFHAISRRNEYAADRFGAELGGKENLVLALRTLIRENRSFPKSHPLQIFFYHSHPPVLERLKALGHAEG